jgi:hypothetical protein
MNVSISMVALLGAGVFVAYRYTGLRIWHAVLCLVCGFLIASTSAAPQIRADLATVFVWLLSGGKA